MTTSSTNSVNGGQAKQPWYRLHLSTWMVILLTWGTLVIVVVPGQLRSKSYSIKAQGNSATSIIGSITPSARYEHGWPWSFFNREASVAATQDIPWIDHQAWQIGNYTRYEFSFSNLLADILAALGIIFTIAILFEWRRRRLNHVYQFTLRDLLSLITIAAIILSTWKVFHEQQVRELNFADKYIVVPNPGSSSRALSIPSCYLTVNDDYASIDFLSKILGSYSPFKFRTITEFHCAMSADHNPIRRCFSCLGEFPNLRKASVQDVWIISDEMLRNLNGSKHLESLEISPCPKITDEGLETISHLHKLKKLKLHYASITDHGLRCLSYLPALERLDIEGAEIDDRAAETLGTLENLKELDVSRTKFTDNSISYFVRLSKLKTLNISSTEITEKGCQEFKAMLPDCSVTYKH